MVQLTSASISNKQNAARKFEVKFGQLDRGNRIDALAIAILERAACFAPNTTIPMYLIKASLKEKTNSSCSEESRKFHQAISRLFNLKLIDKKNEELKLEECIGKFIQTSIDATQAQMDVEETLLEENRRVNSCSDRKAIAKELIPLEIHLIFAIDNALKRRDKIAGDLANELGYFLVTRLKYPESISYFERSLAIREEVLGSEHSDVIVSLMNLGFMFQLCDEGWRAKPVYQRVLAIREKVLGTKHIETADTLYHLGDASCNIANLIRDIGDSSDEMLRKCKSEYEEAFGYYQSGLTIYEELLGNEHGEIANKVDSLGYVLESLREFNKAFLYYERALAIREKVVGDQHPDTINTLMKLGLMLEGQGQLDKAKAYYERVKSIRERIGINSDIYDIKLRLQLMEQREQVG